MTLPEGFSEWEHLQYTVKRAHNDAVRDYFRSQPENDIDSPKAAVKHACLMKDEDTASMTSLRMWLFWVMCRKMRDNFEPYMGVRPFNDENSVTHRPQVTFFFLEDTEDIDPLYGPVKGVLSVRLMNETSQTLTQSNLQTLANRINLEFGQGNGFVWKKGKEHYTYVDKPLGHRHKVLARNKSDAVEIIRKLLDITQDPYKSKLVRLNVAEEPEQAFPSNPGTQLILGETYKEPRSRPVRDVRFIYAQIKLSGLPKPIILVDKSGYWMDAIIRAW